MTHVITHIRTTFSPPFFLLLYLPPVVLLLLIIFVSAQSNIPLGDFMRDPSMTAGVSPFLGAVSNFGALVWCAAAAICFFTATLLRQQPETPQSSPFLFYFGLMSLLLLADDFFLIHEQASRLGLSEKYFFLIYGIAIMAGLLLFKKEILTTDYLLFLIALTLFGASIGVDVMQSRIEGLVGEWRILFEDGFKFLGIVGWMGYFARYSFGELHKFLKH